MSTRTLYAACTCTDWSHAYPQRRQWWPTLTLADRDAERGTAPTHIVSQATTVTVATEADR